MNIVFILNEFSLHNHIVERYLAARPGDRISIVKVPLVLKGRGRAETAARVLPKLSRRFVFWKLQEFGALFAITLTPKILRHGAVFRRLRVIAWRNKLPFHRSENVMSERTLEFVRQQEPDLVVTLMHQILKPMLISIPRLGVINIHPGLLPTFRGIQPYFWELMVGHGEAGPTIHYIRDESIDTGEILASASYRTWPGLSVQLNYYLTSLCAAALLPDVTEAIEKGESLALPQAAGGSYYGWPDSTSVGELYRQGHSLVSLSDLWAILSGKFDNFAAERTTLARRGA